MDNINLLKNYILYFLTFIFICLIGITNVMAWTNSNGVTYNAIGYITSDTDLYIDVTYDTQSQTRLGISTNQTVYTEIKTLYLELGYSFYGNVRYQVELSLGGLQLSYANIYTVYDNQNNKACLISLTDSIMNNDSYPRWDFQCEDNTQDITITIFNSNNGKITEYGYFSWTYSHLYNSTDLITSTDNNNDIIINNNENTDRIINNQNANTQDIINNQNANTDKEIESQKVCNIEQIDYTKTIINRKYLNDSGEEVSSTQQGITDYISITEDTEIKLLEKYSNQSNACFYNKNKVLISCIRNSQMVLNENLTIPNNSYYIRFSINRNLQIPVFTLKNCKNGNQAVSDSINDLNDTLKDTNVDTSGLDNVVGWLPPGPVDSIINLPLNLFSAYTNALGLTCSSLVIPLPYINQNLTIPCVRSMLESIGIWSWWNTFGYFLAGYILYNYLLSLYKWVDDTLSLRENTMPGYYDDNFGGGA